MGRGLSQQQHNILAALPWLTDGMNCGDAPTATEILDLIGLDFTPSNRASVSRAVSRLYRRGLILNVWGWHRSHQRTGYARATPEQVASFKARQQEFVARTAPRAGVSADT